MDYFQLKKDIENNNIENVYIFTGSENFLKNSAIDIMIEKYVPLEVRELNISYINEETSVKDIIDMYETLPFLADKRLLIIKDINYIKDDEENIKKFAEKLKSGNDLCLMLIIADGIPKQYQSVSKVSTSVTFVTLNETLLVKWLIELAKKDDVTLKKENAELIIRYCLSDMTVLKNELDKLIMYVKDKNSIIEKEYIDLITTKSVQYNVFKMLDYFEQGNFKNAYEMLNEVNSSYGQSSAILGAIAARYRNIYYVKSMQEKGYRGDSIKNELGMNQYAFQAAVNSAKNISKSKINRVFELLSKADYDVKSGALKEEDALENLFINLFLEK